MHPRRRAKLANTSGVTQAANPLRQVTTTATVCAAFDHLAIDVFGDAAGDNTERDSQWSQLRKVTPLIRYLLEHQQEERDRRKKEDESILCFS